METIIIKNNIYTQEMINDLLELKSFSDIQEQESYIMERLIAEDLKKKKNTKRREKLDNIYLKIKYGITNNDIEAYGLYYDEVSDGIVMTIDGFVRYKKSCYNKYYKNIRKNKLIKLYGI